MICEECTNCGGNGAVVVWAEDGSPGAAVCLNCRGTGQMCLLSAEDKQRAMSRQALIEQLTQAVYADYSRPFPLMWDDEPDLIHRQMRRTAETCLPVIVDFVADWMEKKGVTYLVPHVGLEGAADAWREEMQP